MSDPVETTETGHPDTHAFFDLAHQTGAIPPPPPEQAAAPVAQAPYVAPPGSFMGLAAQANAHPDLALPTTTPIVTPPVTNPVSPPPVAVVPNETYTPPGPQTVSTTDKQTTFTSGAKLDPKLLAAQNTVHADQVAAQNDQIAALKKSAEARTAQASATALVEQQHAEAAQRAHVERVQAEQAEEQRLAQQADAVKSARDARAALGDKPPEVSVGTQITNRIALALGAFGAGLTGGPNHAAAIIAGKRKEELDNWQHQFTRAGEKLTDENNLYGLYRDHKVDKLKALDMANEDLNKGFEQTIRATAAKYNSPIVQANAEAALEELQASNAQGAGQYLHQQQQQFQSSQGRSQTTVNNKSVTKEGGGSAEDKTKVLKLANDDEFLKHYRETSTALSRFQDLRKAGADGAALADFIANKGGLGQGSYKPEEYEAALKRRGVFGKTYEELRSKFAGGVPPDLLEELGAGLALSTRTARHRAEPSIRDLRRDFASVGMNPDRVTGGESATEAATSSGFVPGNK